MLDLNNLVWYEISESEEQAMDSIGNIFTREKSITTLSLYCKSCKNIIYTIEDVESMKSDDLCSICKETNCREVRENNDSLSGSEK